jgi:hypothetical protein
LDEMLENPAMRGIFTATWVLLIASLGTTFAAELAGTAEQAEEARRAQNKNSKPQPPPPRVNAEKATRPTFMDCAPDDRACEVQKKMRGRASDGESTNDRGLRF